MRELPVGKVMTRHRAMIAPRAARRLDHERDQEVELDCHHMAFGLSKRAAREVASEVERFLAALPRG